MTLIRYLHFVRKIGDVLAELGMTPSTFSMLASGRLKPSQRQLELLGKALHVDPPSALFEEVELTERQQALVDHVLAEQAVTP